MTTALHQLAEFGQSPWIDYLSRSFVRDGSLSALIDDGISGVTSNPTSFQRAVGDSDAYDAQLREILGAEENPKAAVMALACRDAQAACDLLRNVFDRSRGAHGGWVSIEVDPSLAYDPPKTIEAARRLHARVARPNLLVKIPGTEPGLKAIEETVAEGISVNVTLLFSLERHEAAAEAYIRGLQRLRDRGGDLSAVGSVASFFISRIDAEADRRLEQAGGYEELRGTLAIANAKLAYQTYKQVFRGPDWDELTHEGASAQRCLWASTGTKNPAYRDVRYVEELIGAETVTTMPPETVEALLDHGSVEETLESGLEDVDAIFERFDQAGLDYDDIVAVLERDGVQKFADSFNELLTAVSAKRHRLAAT